MAACSNAATRRDSNEEFDKAPSRTQAEETGNGMQHRGDSDNRIRKNSSDSSNRPEVLRLLLRQSAQDSSGTNRSRRQRLGIRVLLACQCVLLLLFGPATARLYGAEWPDEYRAGQFVCHADFPLAPIHNLIDSMPALQDDLVRLLDIDLSSQPIHVFLFEHKTTYHAYVKYHFPTAPARKALFIKERGLCMVFAYRGEDFEVDLRHESTHALLNAALPMVPLWLDEGLAEYFEVTASQRASGNPHMSLIKWGARFGQVPDLDALEELRGSSQMNRSEYRHAWAWVHFLLHGPPEAREELQHYLADIQALTPPGQLALRLRRRLPDLEARFAEHFKQW